MERDPQINGRTQKRARLILHLRAQFGDCCFLCGFPMKFTKVDGGENLQASIEHVIPVPHCGKKRNNSGLYVDNIRLSHRYCNSVRKNFDITPELRHRLRSAVGNMLKKTEVKAA